ncbi:hypothetical protein C8J57DRAFT_1522123 [Mycena rebaudengoi]|nr:hypothetical protein C8J57DRAFT_1522123 [Mycena rebaudengoi]
MGKVESVLGSTIHQEFDEYTDAVRQQAVDHEMGRIRSISKYLQLRRGTIGVRPSFDLFLLTDDLPDSVVDHPHIETYRKSVLLEK